MSATAPTDALGKQPAHEQPFFWIRATDEKGFEVDKRFIEAAYQKTRDFRLYRSQELPDQAVRADLVEKAVYAASRAQKADTVRDPKAYLFSTFARLIDERITTDRISTSTSPLTLDQLQILDGRPNCTDPSIERRILRDQVLNAMSPEDRWIWERRLLGYALEEIAAQLNVSADSLSTRLRRGLQEVSRVLRLKRARQ